MRFIHPRNMFPGGKTAAGAWEKGNEADSRSEHPDIPEPGRRSAPACRHPGSRRQRALVAHRGTAGAAQPPRCVTSPYASWVFKGLTALGRVSWPRSWPQSSAAVSWHRRGAQSAAWGVISAAGLSAACGCLCFPGGSFSGVPG